MKITILIFSFLINSVLSGLMASEKKNIALSTSKEIFNSKWNFTPLILREAGRSKIQTKLFKRQIWIGGTPVDIANTTFTFLENPTQDSDPRKNELSYIADSIKRSFGSGMVVKGRGDNFNVEGKFEKINRYIKVSLLRKNNYVIVVTTFARLGLYEKLENEIIELHTLLESYNGKRGFEKKTSWIKWLPLINEAYAAELDLASILGGTNTTDNLEDLTSSVKNINKSISSFNTTLDNTNVQIEKSNANWVDTNKQAEKFNSSIAESNKNWAVTNQEAAKANSTASKFADEAKMMNTNWAESNKMLALAMDPNHMAKVAFYTAAGAALGGVAVNLAIQGVSEGIGFLHELFTGAKKKKLEWEDFEKAMALWDNQLNDLVKMEQLVDNYLAAFGFFEGKNLGNDYVKQLTLATRDMRFDRDIFMEKYRNSNLDISCRKIYYDAADELDQKVKEYDKIIAFATNNSMSIKNQGANYFCNQLKELQRKILGAETQMQDLRLKILVAENQFYGKQSDSLDKRDENIDKVNGKLKQTLSEKQEYDNKIMDRIRSTHQQTKDDWLKACYEGKNEQGIAISKELSNSFLAYFKKRNKCSEYFVGIEESLKKRDEDAIRRIASEEEFRKSLVVKANNSVEMQLSEEQMSWMSRVHMDAYCYQFAHGDKAKVPKKCNEFPEILYSMSLSQGFDKAKNAYVSKCSERYILGLKQIASPKD